MAKETAAKNFTKNDDGSFAIERLEIFRSGDYGYKGAYSDADVAAIAAAYDPAKHEAPVTVDHEQRGPAYGWASKVWADGGRLYAKLGKVPAEFAELIKRGAFKKRSVEIYPSGNEHFGGQAYLKAVSFLGAAAPAVKGMEDPAFAEAHSIRFASDAPANEIEFSEQDEPAAWAAGLFARIEKLEANQGKEKQEASKMADQITAEQFAASELALKDSNARVATLEGMIAARDKADADARKASRVSAFSAAFDKAVADKKRLPADREKMAKRFDAFCRADDAVATFAEGEKPAADEFLESLSDGPVLAVFTEKKPGEKGAQGFTGQGEKPKDVAIYERTIAIQKEEQIEFGEAFIRASTEFAALSA